MLTTTTISPTNPPVTVTVTNTSFPSHLRHALIIDLDLPSKQDSDQSFQSFLDHLRSITKQPIDILQFRGDTPSLSIWQALKDLKDIAHLEMISGYDEYCNIGPLDEIGSSWPLQSMVIGSACSEDINTAHICTIDSLTLDYCCGLSFKLATNNGTSKLRCLTIIENDACDHFIKLQQETCLTQNLVELKVQSTNGCDFAHQYEEECFGKVLVQCHSLKFLELVLHDGSDDAPEEHYLTELPAFFPPNVEILQFRGPPTLANHMSQWYKCISDPTWLPNLKSIKFHLDVQYCNKEIVLEKANQAHEQCGQFLKELASLRPVVTILNGEEEEAAVANV